MDSLLTVKETAQYLKLNYMTVYKLVQKGKIPVARVGGNWRVNKEMLDQWLNAQSEVLERTILIVDDDINIRDILTEIISEHGYKVVAVGNGEDAIKEVKKKHFDLVFLDLILPGLNGVEVMNTIKITDKKTVVVIVTGYGDDPLALRAMSLGPLVLIRKPFQIQDIEEILRITLKAKTLR